MRITRIRRWALTVTVATVGLALLGGQHDISGLAGLRDVAVHQQYSADIEADARHALGTVDGTPYYQKYPDNPWAAVKGHLHAVAEATELPHGRPSVSQQR
jgi:hypothetical protein